MSHGREHVQIMLKHNRNVHMASLWVCVGGFDLVHISIPVTESHVFAVLTLTLTLMLQVE